MSRARSSRRVVVGASAPSPGLTIGVMHIPDGSGLEGKVAIVAGGGAAGDGIGNGRAAAILLAREGARVLVVDRLGELAERTAKMIAESGGEAAACSYRFMTAESELSPKTELACSTGSFGPVTHSCASRAEPD